MNNKDYVWESVLDGQYHCSVTRMSDYKGILEVVHQETQKLILSKEVTLSYRAIFGPDVDDVNVWQGLCMEAVDSDSK
jgi:hypothetical protein